MLVVRNPTTRCPAAVLRPLSALPPPPPRPPLQPLPVLLSRASVRPATATPVHSPSFLMLGSYSRCAERELSLSPPVSLPLAVRLSPPPPPLSPSLTLSLLNALRALLALRPFLAFLALSLSLSLSRYRSPSLPPQPYPRAPFLAHARALFRKKKKEEDLGQFLSHKPADRAAPIKNASLRMAIGPQRASGVMPNRSLSRPPPPRGLPLAVGVSFRRAFSGSLAVLLVRSLAPLCLFRPFLLFFRRGEKMRAARRLVEGTDDVVSDVPPPGLGGGDARETMVRGRAVECERRHRRVHISRGVLHARAGGGAGAEGGVVVVVVVVVQGEGGRRGADRGEPRRSNWKYYYTRRACGISACGELRGGGGEWDGGRKRSSP